MRRPYPACEAKARLAAAAPELLKAVQRARRHAMNIGIESGSYVETLDAAILKATRSRRMKPEGQRAPDSPAMRAPSARPEGGPSPDDFPMDPEEVRRRRKWIEELIPNLPQHGPVFPPYAPKREKEPA